MAGRGLRSGRGGKCMISAIWAGRWRWSRCCRAPHESVLKRIHVAARVRQPLHDSLGSRGVFRNASILPFVSPSFCVQSLSFVILRRLPFARMDPRRRPSVIFQYTYRPGVIFRRVHGPGVIFGYSATPGVIFGQNGTLCDNF